MIANKQMLTATVLGIIALSQNPVLSQTIPGMPEPGLVMYGAITNTGPSRPMSNVSVNWRVTSGAATFTNQATMVTVNGQVFYIQRVPFETRSIPGTTAFTATPNTLELLATPATYTRSATVNGSNAVLQATSTFTFGSADRGRIERVDMSVSLPRETFAEWALRIFGATNIDPNADPDHDGASNMQEYLAGTDPLSNQSIFKFINIQPAPSGGIIIQWNSVAGQSYTIQSSANVATNYTQIRSGIQATTNLTQYIDTTATGYGPFFYRLKLE